MQINPEYDDYLTGASYTNHLDFKLMLEPEDFQYITKKQFLQFYCKKKKVIHAGFVDHTLDTIDRKIRKNTWLHKNLSDIASRCFGLDINEEGVNYVKNTLGYSDVECADVLAFDCNAFLLGKWDYLLVPDVLEHQNNPVWFLSQLSNKYRDVVGSVILTVPNAFARANFRTARSNCESINSDHRFWFSPYTLSKVIFEAGLKVDRIYTCRNGTIKKWSFIRNFYYSRKPYYRNTLIAIAKW